MSGRATGRSPLLPCPHLGASLGLVEPDGREDDNTQSNFLGIRIDVRKVETVIQNTDEERTRQSPEQASASTAQAGSSHHYCGDNIELVLQPRVGRTGSQPSRQGDPRQARKQTVQRIDEDLFPLHANAR